MFRDAINKARIKYEKIKIENIAMSLMTEWGVADEYDFKWDNDFAFMGQCGKGSMMKYISLSEPFFLISENRIEIFEDVIRHEIAHALCPSDEANSTHGDLWKEYARMVGASPEASKSVSDFKWENLKGFFSHVMVDSQTNQVGRTFYEKPPEAIYANLHTYSVFTPIGDVVSRPENNIVILELEEWLRNRK